jgi:hypothetical protein
MVARTLRQRALNLRKRLMIPGVVKEVMITSKLIAGVLAPQMGIRNHLGANQISLWEIRKPRGASLGLVMIMVETVGVDLDVDIEAEEGILGMVDPRGMEETETMNQVVKGLNSHGTGEISMLAEEEEEVAMGEVIITKVTATLGQEMVAVGALARVMVVAVVVTIAGMATKEAVKGVKEVAGLPTGMATKEVAKGVKEVAGLPTGMTTKEVAKGGKEVAGLPTGMPTKEAMKGVKVLQKASPAGKRRIHLVEMTRQERVMQTTPGTRTDHLPLSWGSQAVQLVVVELEAEVPGERAMKIAGIRLEEQPQRSLLGEVVLKLPPRKMMMAHGEKAVRAVAKEEVVAVPGTKRWMVHGTATRVVMPAAVDGKRAGVPCNKAAPHVGVTM